MVDQEPLVESALSPSPWLSSQAIFGPAGSGKTTSIQLRIALGETGIKLCASTGIAAVNLGPGVSTIHSTLGFFDEQTIRDRWVSGRLTTAFDRLIRAGTTELVVDEVSMLSGDALDCIWKAAEEAAERRAEDPGWQPFTLTLVGDACQLAPVKADRWFHEAQCWPQFKVTRLEKVWRQADPNFLAAMAAARRGDGPTAVEALLAAGVEFLPGIQEGFPGATLFGKNDEALRFNQLRLGALPAKLLGAKSSRWLAKGVSAPSEWKHIPEQLQLKVGALVMLKANSLPDFRYANGDLGEILEWSPEQRAWLIRLKRTGEVVEIQRVTRQFTQRDLPPWVGETASGEAAGRAEGKPWLDREGRWVLGEVQYFPLKLAYATTVHSSQGLTLSHVQMDIRNHFTGEPGMAYVAMSRCQSPEGLKVVGTPEKLAKRIKMHPKAAQWA